MERRTDHTFCPPLNTEWGGLRGARGDAFIIDRMPLPVCHRVRARRWRNARGRALCGYGAANDERLFGWRMHLICTPNGARVREGRSSAAPLQRPLTT